jgi:hypothetical protein
VSVCISKRLTISFLQDPSGSTSTVSTAHSQALSLITLVCSILSIVGLTITIVTHSCYKNLRTTVPSRLLICLCLALLASLILFLIASHADLSGGSCQTVGVLMQFAWLCSMCWWCRRSTCTLSSSSCWDWI